jgi:hypothetical protein
MTPPTLRLLWAALVATTVSGHAIAAAAQDFGERCGELPGPVAAKRDAIREAAGRDDLAALAALATPEDAFGFGDVEDIGEAWAAWKQQGTDMAAIARALLELDCSLYRHEGTTYYSWPAAVDLPVNDLTPEEKDRIAALNGIDFASTYLEDPETGYYVGWRIVIENDGRWTAFVAGD